MARLAWFTPLPPTRSGIAAYNAELLPFLAPRHQLDVFAEPVPDKSPWPTAEPLERGNLAVFAAHDFVWKHHRDAYDLVVYQLGNARCHDFMWPHLARYPGLVVLHDAQLHHARARRLLTSERLDEYRAEFRYNHPDAPPDVAELVIATLADSLYYFYPMLRWVVRSARLVAVHSPGLAVDLPREYPGVEVHAVRHGLGDPGADAVVRGAALRERLGLPGGAVLFAAFGLVTPEKRIDAALRALAALAATHPGAHLLLAGGTAPHYDAVGAAAALGIADRVHVTGYVADEDLPAWVAAADVCLCLRWPTGRETSGTWLRAIAAGKPTIVTDLAHTAQVPSLGAATWDVLPAWQPRPGTPAEPISVAVDILEEDGQLVEAMRRLAADPVVRQRLGSAARRYWALHHTMACAVEDYDRVLARALECPVRPSRDLPPHLAVDPLQPARSLAAEMGIDIDSVLLTPVGSGDTLDCPGRGRTLS